MLTHLQVRALIKCIEFTHGKIIGIKHHGVFVSLTEESQRDLLQALVSAINHQLRDNAEEAFLKSLPSDKYAEHD